MEYQCGFKGIFLSICLSIYLSIYLSSYLSIYIINRFLNLRINSSMNHISSGSYNPGWLMIGWGINYMNQPVISC